MIKNILIEGVDRLGKSTLINGLMDELGLFHVTHFEKPKVLKYYRNLAMYNLRKHDPEDPEIVKASLLYYQMCSFNDMFHLMQGPRFHIMDRAHLGETVYAPRYRGYSGDYVFNMEEDYREGCELSLLVLLTTSDFSFVQDDGQSFDFGKKEAEQNDFTAAFERSKIRVKLKIDVNDQGKFRSPERILDEVLDVYLGE